MYIDAETKKAVSRLLRQRLEEAQLTDTEYMRRYGISSPSYFNQVKNGTYSEKYPQPEYWSQIAQAVGYLQDRYWRHFDLIHFQHVSRLCARAHVEREAWVLDGDTGYGKSYALRHYYRDPQGGPGKVYYYRASDEHLRPGDLMRGLLAEMGVRKIPISLAAMTARVQEELRRQGGLLIIDECEYLSMANLKQIRKLVYETEGRCGMIICGAGVADRLARLATRKDGLRLGWSQFWSRLQWNTRELGRIGHSPGDQEVTDRWAQEVRGVCQALGIEDNQAVAWLARHTHNYRDLNRIITKALHGAEQYQQSVSPALLEGISYRVMEAV